MNSKDIRSLQEAYMEVVMNELDEGTAGDVAARATQLARQRKGQTPERRATYKNLAQKASERENPPPSGRDLNNRSNMTSDFRRTRRGQSDWNIEHDKPGTVTKNPKKLRKQKALGEIGEQVDIYDIILSHLLDEGYAETIESAEAIMVNMSEDWREDIVEKFISPFKGRVSYNNPQGLSPAMKAGHKSDELQRTEPGSERQKKQTRRSQQLDRMYHAAKTAHLR